MIKVNIEKAKEIAHTVRRNERAELFKPLDIEATIPMYAEQAEAKRQAIRERFEKIQADIDNASDLETLNQALHKCKEA